jgi:glycosyltransferase involved in cell wall biosynthesis
MLKIIEVPKRFAPRLPFAYPPHQIDKIMIEEKCMNYFKENCNKISSEYIYLPIQWTAYHLLNGYGKNLEDLIDYYETTIKKFPKSNFFTIVQYDGGTLIKLKNCRIFSCSGDFMSPIGENSCYEPIPLICDKHPIKNISNKKYKVTFCGRKTHGIREKIFLTLKNENDYFLHETISNKFTDIDTQIFRYLINNSIFTLCPRGYGPTSFRLYESIQMKSIPIYISDKFWLPYENEIKWSKFALCINENQINNIPQIVDNIIKEKKYEEMIKEGQHIYEKYFTWDSIIKNIVKNIEA